MKEILYAGIILLTIATGYGMGIAMMGDKMTDGQGKQHDKKQGETKSGQTETDSQKITDDNKKHDEGLIGCHSGTTQDNQKEDDKPADMTNRK